MAIWKGAAKKLDDYDLPRIGSEIGVGEDVIHGFLEVETRGTGFDKLGRVIILFEPHKFYKHLPQRERQRAMNEGLAYPKWRPGRYPKDSYPRLEKAFAIDETAALMACSWGLGQTMGENYRMCGYDNVQAMVTAYADDEANQLQGSINYCKAADIADDLRRLEKIIESGRVPTPTECIPVVRVYNGEGFAENQYHIRLSRAIAKWMKIKDTPWSKDMSIQQMAEMEEASHEATNEINNPAPVEAETPAPEKASTTTISENGKDEVIAKTTTTSPETGKTETKEVKMTTSSFQAKVTSWVTWASGVGMAVIVAVWKGLQYMADHPALLGFMAFLVVIGFLAWAWSGKLNNDRVIAVAHINADKTKHDVEIV